MKRFHATLLLLMLGLLLAACCYAAPDDFETARPAESLISSVEAPPTEQIDQTTPVASPSETAAALEPGDTDFVRVADYVPGILVDLKYATADNFTGQVIYDFSDAYLRYGTVKKLAQVQRELNAMGLGLKIWDGFRPTAAQFRLWEICPDPTYVANPNTGFSSHSRGNTVDVTLVDSQGNALPMPTGFDDFSSLADRDYSDCPEDAAGNALLLENIMEKYGFFSYFGEWWHFSDTTEYPVDEAFTPE